MNASHAGESWLRRQVAGASRHRIVLGCHARLHRQHRNLHARTQGGPEKAIRHRGVGAEQLRVGSAQDQEDPPRSVALLVDELPMLVVPLVGRHGEHDRERGRRVPRARARDHEDVDPKPALEDGLAHPLHQILREGAAQQHLLQVLNVLARVLHPLLVVDPVSDRMGDLLVHLRVVRQRVDEVLVTAFLDAQLVILLHVVHDLTQEVAVHQDPDDHQDDHTGHLPRGVGGDVAEADRREDGNHEVYGVEVVHGWCHVLDPFRVDPCMRIVRTEAGGQVPRAGAEVHRHAEGGDLPHERHGPAKMHEDEAGKAAGLPPGDPQLDHASAGPDDADELHGPLQADEPDRLHRGGLLTVAEQVRQQLDREACQEVEPEHAHGVSDRYPVERNDPLPVIGREGHEEAHHEVEPEHHVDDAVHDQQVVVLRPRAAYSEHDEAEPVGRHRGGVHQRHDDELVPEHPGPAALHEHQPLQGDPVQEVHVLQMQSQVGVVVHEVGPIEGVHVGGRVQDVPRRTLTTDFPHPF
mmetsp:Transcript_16400/g.49358  ORF Transcript_16400/g.49358 Transcript_16400/m.49358 type:complete len:523 (+) Transcript_16400:1413-2981(+)